ncbi:Fascin-like incomplete domain containing protein [Pandoravirus dulcis]|uniref:Fascin-like incomplete domain containing protein n=1 Tax=Pandoravirus dulcis TaxID=1349409 RepID=S4VPQ8_9VIRU|nr:Fascin-like incomplete domain containing protein [Pandoravirus dulcis]AGO82257.2 Fascin-like incomplete domain containing protein [Pandoravirus dulcis]
MPLSSRSSRATGATMALLALLYCAAAVDAYRYTVFVGASTNWTAPVGATDVSVTLWGGGGASSSSFICGAGGGSGSAILNRTAGDAQWAVAPSDVRWVLSVGKGGAIVDDDNTAGSIGGDGGETSVVALDPDGVELFRATAYGGGGGKSVYHSWDRCRGGGGGGASSSAVGPVPGGGNPPGAVDDNPSGGPPEGALAGDVKAGGAGAGYGRVNDDIYQPYVHGAGWTKADGYLIGGTGRLVTTNYGTLISWGGAAGFNGQGGNGYQFWREYPPANSGSGGGSGSVAPPGGANGQNGPGADGGVIIEYNHPVAPTPSNSPTPTRTPSSTPTRSPTPSVTPSPTAQPLSQLVTLVSPISGKQLTPQEDGSVKSLWYGASYKEKWTVARLSNGKYTFKGFNGRYLGANPGGWVRAEATSVGAWEQWDILINAGNQWTLKSTHGTYMGTTVAGVIYLNGDSTLYWTKTNV